MSSSILVILSPSDLHQTVDRAETVAIFGILTFEILKVFDDVLVAVSGSADGILTKLGKQILIVILIGYKICSASSYIRSHCLIADFDTFQY